MCCNITITFTNTTGQAVFLHPSGSHLAMSSALPSHLIKYEVLRLLLTSHTSIRDGHPSSYLLRGKYEISHGNPSTCSYLSRRHYTHRALVWLDSPCTRGISCSMRHELAFTLPTATFTLHPEGRPSKDCNFASRRHGAVGLLYYKRHQLDARIAWRPEYKTRERIHPGLADPGLLAIPAS